jgi:hypothetical protein
LDELQGLSWSGQGDGRARSLEPQNTERFWFIGHPVAQQLLAPDSCCRQVARKLLSMSSDFVALLAGIVGVIFTGVGVVALYVSATNAQK